MVDLHPFAKAIMHHLVNKEVEINCGDSKTVLKFNEYDYCPKNIIRGTILDAMGDCLIVGVLESKIFLNVYAIKSISPLDNVSLKDMYVDDEFGLGKKRK